MYYFYGMEKGVANSMKNPELIELFADNITSLIEGITPVSNSSQVLAWGVVGVETH